MARKKSWSFMFVSSGSLGNGGRKVSAFILLLLVVFVAFIAVGVGRTAYFTIRYSYAKYSYYEEKSKNKELRAKLNFVDGFTSKYTKILNNYVSFDDANRIKLGLRTISSDVRRAGVGGRPTLMDVVEKSFMSPYLVDAENIENRLSELERKIAIEDSTLKELLTNSKLKAEYWAQYPSIWPVHGRITSGFGYRMHPFLHRRVFHKGFDIANEVWTPVVATADGIVYFSGRNGNYGNMVKIQHISTGIVTYYAHLIKCAVSEGEFVKRGDIIGYLGNTGRSTGPHVHYEIKRFGESVNPKYFLLPQQVVID